MLLLASEVIHELSYCTVCLLFSQEAGAKNKFLGQGTVSQSLNGTEKVAQDLTHSLSPSFSHGSHASALFDFVFP